MPAHPLHKAASLFMAASLLVVGVDIATYAATGDSLLIGKSNKASKTTKLKTTGNGPALSLKSKTSSPALKVSNTQKVAKLNADMVDGLSSESMEPPIIVWRLKAAGQQIINGQRVRMAIAPGRYMVTWRYTAFASSAAANFCWVAPDSELTSGDYDNLVASTSAAGFAGISAAGEITVPLANDLVFECENSGQTVTLNAPITVTAQKLTTPATGSLAPPRPSAPGTKTSQR